MPDPVSYEEFLTHYGVKGMKWGVRKNTTRSLSRAFRKASTKQTRLTNRANKLAKKGAKLQIRGVKRGNTKTHFKGLRAQYKSAKVQQKADRWEKAMRETFADVEMSSISEKSLEKGAQFTYMLRKK